MADPELPGGVFARPFAEQVAFFRRKLGNLVPTERWDDMVREAHDDGFMVAGATKAELLTDLAAAVDKAIAEGRGIEEFRTDFETIVARNGWTDYTGSGSLRGRAWRVGVIYRTNAYTSYAAGRRAQLEAGDFVYWVYRHGGSEEPRPEHLGWNGTALPPGDRFWERHYPPSDWGCSCYVVGASSEAGAKRVGAVRFTRPANWDRIDPKTGAPVGIGRNWDYAPGSTTSRLVNAMAEKIGRLDYQIAKAFMAELPASRADALADAYRSLPSTADDARRYAQRVFDPKPELEPLPPARTLGRLRSDQAAAVNAGSERNAAGFDFALSPSEVAHAIAEHGNDARERRRGQRAITAADFARLPRLLTGSIPRLVGTSRGHRQPIFEITARVGDEEFVTRWEFRNRQRSLTLLSFFVRTGVRA